MPAPGEFARGIQFDGPSPLATNAVLIRRLLTPRGQNRTISELASKGETLAPYPLVVGTERFSVYVPKQQPAAGYGLLVFIPPWDEGRLPAGWAQVLDRSGVVFVSAEHSGNEQPIARRRIPLALTAASASMRQYRIDPDRTFIAGFSGGSRVALRVAIAYPDVFRGVLLNAGSDPIGNREISLPSADLMSLLQSRTRFVFLTGAHDEVNINNDLQTRRSLTRWCMSAVDSYQRPQQGHEVTDAAGLSYALDALSRPRDRDPMRASRCRASLEVELELARGKVASLSGEQPSAKIDAALDHLDEEYGGLLERSDSQPDTAK